MTALIVGVTNGLALPTGGASLLLLLAVPAICGGAGVVAYYATTKACGGEPNLQSALHVFSWGMMAGGFGYWAGAHAKFLFNRATTPRPGKLMPNAPTTEFTGAERLYRLASAPGREGGGRYWMNVPLSRGQTMKYTGEIRFSYTPYQIVG